MKAKSKAKTRRSAPSKGKSEKLVPRLRLELDRSAGHFVRDIAAGRTSADPKEIERDLTAYFDDKGYRFQEIGPVTRAQFVREMMKRIRANRAVYEHKIPARASAKKNGGDGGRNGKSKKNGNGGGAIVVGASLRSRISRLLGRMFG